jgi:ABC-2 type transport system permease protein
MTAIAVPRSDATLLARWVTARVRMTLRSPRALGFTFAFPLVLVTLFSAINGDVKVSSHGVDIPFSQFYTPAIAIFGLTMACYATLLNGLANAREAGLLKRVRGTPLPMPIYLGSWVAGAVLTGLAAVVLLFAVAIPAFGVDIYPSRLPEALLTAVVGGASLAAIALMLGSMVKTAEQAQPLSQLTLLPVSFISGIWFPIDDAPQWVKTAADIFPLSHIVDAFSACFVAGAKFDWSDLGVVVLWGAGAMVVASRRLRREAEGA